MEIIKTTGEKVQIECEFFADETFPLEEAKKICYNERGQPKCPVWKECYKVYTKRALEE
jgi:hypothetical protein